MGLFRVPRGHDFFWGKKIKNKKFDFITKKRKNYSTFGEFLYILTSIGTFYEH